MSLPTGTVTFLFTDIEGSTKLWEQHLLAMRDALARHNLLMQQAIAASDGIVFKTMGDAFCAAFATAPQALLAAFTAQIALQAEPWPEPFAIHVRMALHTGTVDALDGDYFGQPLNRVARLLSTGHGGQTLLSQSTFELTRDVLPADCSLSDLGAHALRDLARPEQVYQLCYPGLLSEFPPLKSLDSLPNNLPLQLTSFVGRERELAQIEDLLSKTRLLTLTGSGGCGKTRLSLHTAADVLDQYADGVWLVELAPITDPDLVPQTVANVLGIKEQTGKTYIQTLTDHLKVKTLLLILDNCEHVLTACAGLADILLRNCPNLKVLASSREGLGIAGELTYRVPSLSLPAANTTQTAESLSQYESVQLFVERAMFHRPEFTVTNENAPALASVCHRLDGIPLGIELAAARVRSLSVEEINAKMDNQFRLLTGGSKTALPRQQTLRALIDWSYGLLTDPEKALLCRLSVFSGGWTLIAAEAVCSSEEIEEWEMLDLLTSLVDKSLVQAEQSAGQTRYRFLETVRQYARDHLADGDKGMVVRGRHRAYFLAVAEEIKPKLNGPEQAQWFSVLETEHDNLRQAITFCLEEADSGETGLRLGAALGNFWATRGHLSEGRQRLTALLSRPEAQMHVKARADALYRAGILALNQADITAARSFYEESLTIFRELGDRGGIASVFNNLGNVANAQGDYEGARSLYQESLTIQRELENKPGIADCLHNLGGMAKIRGDFALARANYEEGLAISRELRNSTGVALSLHHLGILARDQCDYAGAQSLLEETVDMYRELGNRRSIAYSVINLAYVAAFQGDHRTARSLFEESLLILQELSDRNGIAVCLYSLGSVAYDQGDSALARSLFEESLAIYRALGDRNGIALCGGNLGNIAYDQGDFAPAWSLLEESLAICRELGYKHGVATAHINLGHVARMQSRHRESQSRYTESLVLFREMADKMGIAHCLKSFAMLAVQSGSGERAAHLFGAAEALREEIGMPLPANEREEYDRQAATVRAAVGEERFASAWAAGRAMTMEKAVEYALEERANLADMGDAG